MASRSLPAVRADAAEVLDRADPALPANLTPELLADLGGHGRALDVVAAVAVDAALLQPDQRSEAPFDEPNRVSPTRVGEGDGPDIAGLEADPPVGVRAGPPADRQVAATH